MRQVPHARRGPSGEEFRSDELRRKDLEMFPYNDPYTMLDLQRLRADELSRQVASARRAREAPPRRRGRRPRPARRSAATA